MSRGKSIAGKRAAERSQRITDERYLSLTVGKVIRKVMKDGKGAKARTIVYTAMAEATKSMPKTVELPEHSNEREKELLVLEKVLETLTPRVEVKSRRVGGANYQVPIMVNRERGVTLAIRWLVEAARDRKEGKPMVAKLTQEMVDTLNGRSGSLSKKETQDKMASANRANANLVKRDQAQKDKFE